MTFAFIRLHRGVADRRITAHNDRQLVPLGLFLVGRHRRAITSTETAGTGSAD